jgi:hypothetical protein
MSALPFVAVWLWLCVVLGIVLTIASATRTANLCHFGKLALESRHHGLLYSLWRANQCAHSNPLLARFRGLSNGGK